MNAPVQAARKSAAQKKVLSLYKSLLRVVQTKPIENQPKLRNAVRTEFRHRVDIDRKDFFRVDYYVRRAQKYLDLLTPASCIDLQLFPENEPRRRPVLDMHAIENESNSETPAKNL